MVFNEVNTENSNASRSDDTYTDTNVMLNPIVLLVRVEHVDGRPMEQEILTEATFKELFPCTHLQDTFLSTTLLTSKLVGQPSVMSVIR